MMMLEVKIKVKKQIREKILFVYEIIQLEKTKRRKKKNIGSCDEDENKKISGNRNERRFI